MDVTAETYILVFLACGISVFVKTVQNSNIIHKKLWFITPTSVILNILDALMIGIYAKSGISWLVVVGGVASGLGCVGAIVLYERLFGVRK